MAALLDYRFPFTFPLGIAARLAGHPQRSLGDQIPLNLIRAAVYRIGARKKKQRL
jgi:hypothetical protein